VGGPRGSMIIDPDLDWQLLAGDACALPAMRRRLAELPASARVQLLALVDDAGELDLPASAAQVTVQAFQDAEAWLSSLAQAVPTGGEGYVWCAGEAGLMARSRLALQVVGVPTGAMRVAAYWKRGQSDYQAPKA